MIAEKLRPGRRIHDQRDAPYDHERWPKVVATPESNDAVYPWSHGPAFEQKRGKFKPPALFGASSILQPSPLGAIPAAENHKGRVPVTILPNAVRARHKPCLCWILAAFTGRA
jgi:hypothetical protein